MFRKYRLYILIVAVLVLVALWYAFRPEKLFINHKVDEPPPTSMLCPVSPPTAGQAGVERDPGSVNFALPHIGIVIDRSLLRCNQARVPIQRETQQMRP